MRLVVQLVAWNGGKYIPHLFESLRKQTCKDYFLAILDNYSTDNTAELIKMELENFNFSNKFIQKTTNTGFAGGHNFLFKQVESQESEYILLLNQDMYLAADCLEKLVEFMNNHSDAGVVTPRLMKWDFESIEKIGLDESFTNKVDALGLQVFKNRRVIEQFTGIEWKGSNVETIEVFGVSGTLPMYRTSLLKQIIFSDNNFFDENYHSYKEDVDLAYRIQEAGSKAYVMLTAVAYHDRSAAGSKDLNDITALQNKQKQSVWVKYNSYRNHLMTLYKNEYWQNFLLDFIPIVWYELKKLVYFFIFDRSVLRGWLDIWQARRKLKIKRVEILKTKKINWQQMRKWYGHYSQLQ